MIVDTSALLAILRREPEREHFIGLLAAAANCLMSSGSWIEFAAVDVRRFGGVLESEAVDLMAVAGITIEPVSSQQAEIGQAAYREYGIGTGHRARLNFGDCFAYALAKDTGLPLLFKGDDFSHTDITAAA